MSIKSKNRKKKRLEPKMIAFYENYNKWLEREPTTANIILHSKWEAEEPVKPKWLIDHEESFRKWAEDNADKFDRVNVISLDEVRAALALAKNGRT